MYMQQKTNIAICKPFLLVFFGFDIKNVTINLIYEYI
jgi:hypothetical protein